MVVAAIGSAVAANFGGDPLENVLFLLGTSTTLCCCRKESARNAAAADAGPRLL